MFNNFGDCKIPTRNSMMNLTEWYIVFVPLTFQSRQLVLKYIKCFVEYILINVGYNFIGH